MSYKVLYRKYRPDSFDNLIGQKAIVDILKNSIKDNKIAHAYLFSGPRGTGKTSTARILAKAINCLNNKDGLACNECENCLNFNGNPDIIEIDAASNNGVDEIRELINNVKIMPTSLKYKVYIIDEVHMLSQSAFNALLLTLEEPPAHVVFILATTNIESVPITILSRCQRYDFKKINEDDIYKQLEYICNNENILYEADGLKEISLLADGGLRDALSILDQLSKNNSKITLDLVINEIGSISNKKIDDIITFLDENNYSEIDKIINSFLNSNLNYKVVIKKLINSLTKKAISILEIGKCNNLDYDKCKKLVFELNDIMNKININIEPYLLIKLVLLSYVTSNSASLKTEEEKNNCKIVKKCENNEINNLKNDKEDTIKSKKSKKENVDKFSKLNEIRINNCFVKASKSYLNSFQEMWNKFINNIDINLKGLLSDTKVATASDTYAIVMTTIRHKDLEINENLEEIIKLFNKNLKENYKLIFIDEYRWNEEKRKYIENIKNKYKYEYIEEAMDNTQEDDIEDIVNGVFDMDKIEIE